MVSALDLRAKRVNPNWVELRFLLKRLNSDQGPFSNRTGLKWFWSSARGMLR